MQTTLNLADTLGALNAQIKELEAQASAIKEAILDAATLPGGQKVTEGTLFKATVVAADRVSIDYKALVKALGITQETLDKYSKASTVFSVRVTEKK